MSTPQPMSVAGLPMPIIDPDARNATDKNAGTAAKPGKEEQKTKMEPPTPASLFTFKNNASQTTWRKQAANDDNKYIQILVEREDYPNGAIISDRIEPHLLFKLAPALQKYHLEGRRIYIPTATCLDEETISSVVYSLQRCAKEGIPVPEPLEKKPIPMIKIHCVFALFEMDKEIQDLKAKLWTLFGQVELQPEDVLWIWDTFGTRFRADQYVAPFADEYVQMMAWQILNLDAEGKLSPEIRTLIELEKEPKYFTEVLMAHMKTHGLQKDIPVPDAPQNMSDASGKVSDETSGKTAISADAAQTSKTSKSDQFPIYRKPGPLPVSQAGQNTAISEWKSTSTMSQNLPHESPMDKPQPLSVPFGAPDPRSTSKTNSASSLFSFAKVSKPISEDPDAVPQATAPPLGYAHDNPKAWKATLKDQVTREKPVPLGGSMPAFSSMTSGTPPTPAFGGFMESTNQPASSPVSYATGFSFSSPMKPGATGTASRLIGAFSGSSTEPTPQSFGAFGASPGESSSGWSASEALGGITTPIAAGTSQYVGTSRFGTATTNTPFGTTSNNVGFMTPTIPAPQIAGTNTFGAQAPFGSASNNADFPMSMSPEPHNSGQFNFNAQQTNQAPSGTAFGAQTNSAGENMFTFQSSSGGSTGGNGATGGGMVRKIAKATGPKRRR
ncbi:hypothetical protein N0V90_012363 [Kalmusia sp. IMI 367209]|nr:hypothetical protein N0V90_012363 [Kalmusia sp. IMI 367209]